MARSALTLTPPRHMRRGDVAGFAAGLLAYTLVLNYIRHGREGVSGWWSAKFLNKPMPSPEFIGPVKPSATSTKAAGGTVQARTDTTRPTPAPIRSNA
jgi:hypothetical protein